MDKPYLTATIEKFAAATHAFSEQDLNRPWDWQEYQEGVRFAFFRTYEQLCALAAHLEGGRAASAHPLSPAQRILGQYHSAYRDLQAVLLGVTDFMAEQTPREGEWTVRQALAHIVQTERGFFTATSLGLDHHRARNTEPVEINEAVWNSFWAETPFGDLGERGSLSEILAYYAALHPRILQAFTGVHTNELRLPVKYWENVSMPLEYRLVRFSSHLRQHTIQIEKILVRLRRGPNEARRLLRMIYTALAAVENVTLGDELYGMERQALVAADIEHLHAQVVR